MSMNLLTKIVFLCILCICYCNGEKVPQYGDTCTNECHDGDDRYWCGKIKKDARGRAMQCVQYTKYGARCVAECGGSEKYTWCLTNANKISEGDWWDYCSMAGYTINRKLCRDGCEQRGETYFWCHNDENDKSKWDYCSPPGEVKPVQYTTHKNKPCISECDQAGQNYHWCGKSVDYCSEDSCDEDWGYCSQDSEHTRYNYKCTDECEKRGESYYWCHTEDGEWEYCSPEPSKLVHVDGKIEVTRYGTKCRDKCALKGESYFWCVQYGRSQYNDWDYCSPSPTQTINSADCKDPCSKRGENYYWCNTGGSWDYCSPSYEDKGLGYENVTRSSSKSIGSHLYMVYYFIILILK